MLEGTIDGSNLELQDDQSSNQAEPVNEQVQTETVQPETPTTPQPPQTNIPEQYRDKAPEELIHELQKRDSMLGRYRAEVGNLRQARQMYPQNNPVYNQQIPSSLPGQEASGQRSGQLPPQINETFWEKPAETLAQIVEPIVERKVNQGIQSYQQQEIQRQQQAAMGRAQWISSIDDDELQNLRLEENFSAEHEALMESLAKRDAEIVNKLRDPSLTEQGVRDAVRNLYAKADKILKGQLQDPEKLKAFNAATKQAAANGAPASRASQTSTSSSPIDKWGAIDPRLPEEYGWMADLVNKSNS